MSNESNITPINEDLNVVKYEIEDIKQKIYTIRGKHRKYLPYAFIEMRNFILNNKMLFEKISNIEFKQIEYQKSTDDKFEKVFEYIGEHKEKEQKVFFDGQVYDAFSMIIELIKKAKSEIILIDNCFS